MDGNEGKRSLVGPLVLIALGVVFLLNNLGILGWGVWETILRLWPVLLIAIGLEVLLGHRPVWGPLIIAFVVLGMAGFVTVLSGIHWTSAEPWFGGELLASDRLAEPLAGAKSAEVEIAAGIGALRIGASSDPSLLVEGTITRGRAGRVTRDYRLFADKAHLTLSGHGVNFLPGWRDRHGDGGWDLGLSTQVPTTLRVRTGLGLAEVDLTEIKITEAEFEIGAGRTVLILPRQGQPVVECRGGIGEITIRIPKGMAARIHVGEGIGTVSVRGPYERSGEFYVSPSYDTARDRVDLEVRKGIGSITVMEESS